MNDLPKFLPIDKHFETKAIHASFNAADNPSLGVIPPIVLSTTFHQPDPMEPPHFQYGRYGNPNREMLEITLAALENAKYANCFATGMGAIGMVTHLLEDGDNILCIDDVYGGTYKYFEQIARKRGISITYADLTEEDNIEANMKPNTKLIWLETPTNPLMKILDIVGISKRAKKLNSNVLIVVDNSFLSSYFIRPLELGADIVAASLTKYMNGHSDVFMGITAHNSKDLNHTFNQLQGICGCTPSPFDCYLLLRGLKTLSCRMKVHMSNAYKVARFLEKHSMVEKVLYPGLSTHKGFHIAQQQWHGVGGMLSFYIKGDVKESIYFIQNLKLFSCGQSYGGYEGLVEIPMIMSHKPMPKEQLLKHKITGNLIRLSVGLESVDDIIADIEAAFKAVCTRFCT